MGRYIRGRLLINVPILILITIIIFCLLQFTPGDPIDSFIPPDQTLSQEQRESLRAELGLDRPAPVRYFVWLKEAVTGNLGYRIKTGEPVASVVFQRLKPTLLLMSTAMVIGVTLGVTLGVVSAIKRYSALDFTLTIFAFLGTSLPAFFAGLLALYMFSLRLGWFPSGGLSTPGTGFSIIDRIHHLILPALVLSVFEIGTIMRYTRASMLEVISQDYVRTAYAKGLVPSRVIIRHALSNALLPVITIVGANLPGLVGGAVFTETIFAWPGMGMLYLDAVNGRDFNLLMGMTLILSMVILTINLMTDIMYGVVDPRIRLG